MKRAVTPAVLLVILCAAFVVFVTWSGRQLPEEVATHFGYNGRPDRWNARSSAVALMLGFGLGLPLLMAGFAWAARFMPASCVNIPNREYWLSPERRDATYAFLSRQLLWLACLSVCFMAGLNWLTVQANLSTPVRMPTGPLMTVLGCFLAGIAVWILNFMLYFRRIPDRSSS